MKLGLRGIGALLRSLGNPHKSFVTIHIAGTNGKGSTAAMIAAVLTAAGYKTGLYTSPHVLDFTERIRINGKTIQPKQVIRLMRKLRPLVQRHRTTFFETVTAMAFQHFAHEKVDVAVVETGLGGRLDATNIVRPVVSVITNIGLEHTDILGRTIRQIAFEKAGIIKRNVPCVTGVRLGPALSVVKRVARKRTAPLLFSKFRKVKLRRESLYGSVIDGSQGKISYKNLKVSLPGRHQIENAALALRVIKLLHRSGRFNVPMSAVRQGLARVQSLSGLHARLAVIQRSPLILADVAHNPDAIAKLTESLKNLKINRVVLLFGVSNDKDYAEMIRLLKPRVDRAIVVAAKTTRACPVWELQREFVRMGIPCEAETGVPRGIQRAQEVVRGRQPILITGSHFVVGEALAFLRKKNYLTINQ